MGEAARQQVVESSPLEARRLSMRTVPEDWFVDPVDPRAAEQIMLVTDQVVRTHRLTTLMVTHSMEQAVRFGDRTIMMHRGIVVADLSAEERRGVTEADLLVRFSELRYTTGGRGVASFGLAVNRRYQSNGEWQVCQRPA